MKRQRKHAYTLIKSGWGEVKLSIRRNEFRMEAEGNVVILTMLPEQAKLLKAWMRRSLGDKL